MAKRRAGALTARDRFWLGHLQAIVRSKESATVYTSRAGLSVGALWQAERRLGKLGAWTRRARARGGRRAAERVSFARVAVPSDVARLPTEVRVRVGGGVEVAWPTPPAVEWIAALVERLTARG
jgi:hypothetical protein